tara:strand:- start:226 stop:777 length:552 start_codon:yes stop_codon:yes gene_type:complete
MADNNIRCIGRYQQNNLIKENTMKLNQKELEVAQQGVSIREVMDTMAHKIYYKKITGHRTEINTIFCKIDKSDKDTLINLLEDALYIISEAQHEIDTINSFSREQIPQLGRGNFLKNKKFIGVSAAISGMLKQHKKTKNKDFTIYQIKNIEVLLESFEILNKILIANKWPETIYVPRIKFVEL